MNNTKKLTEHFVVDLLFHDLLEDPPLNTEDNRSLIDILLESGVSAVSTTIVADTYSRRSFYDFLEQVYTYQLLEDTLPDRVKLIQNFSDIEMVQSEGKLGVILSTQGSDIFGGDIRLISIARQLGLLIVQFTYNQDTLVGSGTFEPKDFGITRLGQQMVYEMNRTGMLIDLSHVGTQTSLDVLRMSEAPVIFSHSNAMALCKNTRNLIDEQIVALGKNGGVIGLCPHSVFTTDKPGYVPDVNDFIDHIMYIADKIGIDHVGVGTDRFVEPTLIHKMGRTEFARTLPDFFGAFGISNKQVKGFSKYSEWENLVEAMERRRFSTEDIGKVLGNNALRVFGKVWKK